MFVRNVADDTTGLVSRADGASGANGNGQAFDASISGDGDRIAFASFGTNLDASDTETSRDIFVRDRSASDTSLASVSDIGAPGDGNEGQPAISADGRTVVFESGSSNLYPGFDGQLRHRHARYPGWADPPGQSGGWCLRGDRQRLLASPFGLREWHPGCLHLRGHEPRPGRHRRGRGHLHARDRHRRHRADGLDRLGSDEPRPRTTRRRSRSARRTATSPRSNVSSTTPRSRAAVREPTRRPSSTTGRTSSGRGPRMRPETWERSWRTSSRSTQRVHPVDLDATAGRTTDTTPSFSFTTGAGDFAEFQCRVDAAAYAACTSAFTPAALAEGEHTFRVRALDDLGNIGSEVSRDVTVDVTGPVAVIGSAPSGDDRPTRRRRSRSPAVPGTWSPSSARSTLPASPPAPAR